MCDFTAGRPACDNRRRVVANVPDQPAPLRGSDGSEQTADLVQAAPRQQIRKVVQTTQMRTLGLTTIVLTAGLALLWVTKTVVGIEGDAVFITLLLVPVVVYLVMNDKLQSFSLGGASAVIVQKVGENVTDAVTEVGQREAGRVAYLGKLRQVLGEEGQQFALIYADVDGLRQRMRTIYLKERENNPEGPRRREGQIRREILDQLEFALTDAFYDSGLDKAKIDVFRLAEPDIAMIVRCENPHRAHQVAERAEKLFLDETKGGNTTTAVVPTTHLVGDLTPQHLDEAASRALKTAKQSRENRP